MHGSSGLHRLQTVLVRRLSDHRRCLWSPKLQLQRTHGLLNVTRWAQRADALQKGKLYPDGLESNGTVGEATRVEPAPMRS